ncbi:MAG: CPBP family intramembrane metalloprotease [Lachnospiraceae bacterium]|nr:CPBP family intramembrane metalloprotease [Lachnospiraceae bacterium]
MRRKTSLRKAWEALFPYLLYYLTYNAAYVILSFVYQVTVRSFGGAYEEFMTVHAASVAGVMGGLCMLTGCLPLVSMLKRELLERGEAFGFAKQRAAGEREEAADGSGMAVAKTGPAAWHRKGSVTALTAVLAFSVSLGLNALLTMIGFADSSRTYQEVADRQYGVAFAAGLILYGLISPLAEEVVFRGVIYNRLRRFYSPAMGIVLSGVLFGVFHGNPVQGVYGACLGMLMAYLYERNGSFLIPFLFHAVANLTVYITARMEGVQERLFTPAGCAVLLAVSIAGVLAERRISG